jgi:hypothetical protein
MPALLPNCHVLLKVRVASVCFEFLRYFRGMLQAFQMDVAKVDQDVAYVTMVVHVCCKGMLPMFHLCFSNACCKWVYLDVAYVSRMCLIWMLRMVAMFFKCFQVVFQVFHLPSGICCNCCIWMFQK